MAITLNDKQKKLLADKNFAHVGTINKDGSTQVTPVWIDFDGTHVLFNTEEKRLKVRNMKRDPRVTLSVMDMANPYQYIAIRGRVVEITPEGALEHIDEMAQKYIGQEKYPWNQPTDVRVIVRIEPLRIVGQG